MTLLAAVFVSGFVLLSSRSVCRGMLGRPGGRLRDLRLPEAPTILRSRRRPLATHRGRIVVAVLSGVIGLFVVGPLIVAVVIAGSMLVHRVRPLTAARRRVRSIDRVLPDAIELFILTIQAGLSPVQATRELTASAPVEARDGFRAVVHRLERGEPFAQAVRALPERLGPGMVAFADLVGGADRHGTPIGPVLESLASEVRAARRRLDEADARRLPIRLAFPLVVCTLPSFVLLAIAPAVIAALSSLSLSF